MPRGSRRVATGIWTFALGALLCFTPPALAQAQTPEAIAAAYLKNRNAELVSGPTARAALSASAVAPRLATREQSALAQLRSRREQLAAAGERYTRATTTTRVLNATKTAEGVVLRVEEDTRLDYEKVDGTEPEYTSFTVPRDFAFARGPQGWLLRDVRLVEADAVAPINEVGGGPIARAVSEPSAPGKPRSTTPPTRAADPADLKATPAPNRAAAAASPNYAGTAAATKAAAAAASYDYAAMAAYAKRYAKRYNGAFRRFPNDCTNFISQAMLAGGWKMDRGWYRSNGSWWYRFKAAPLAPNQSFPWAGAENWYHFATGKRRTRILSNVWSMGYADVLQIDFDRNGNINHTMIVTVLGSKQRYLSYHTNETLNRSLSSILAAYPSAWYYAHRT